jgi:hypothetical protein
MPKVGHPVWCPPDRWDVGYHAGISHVSTLVYPATKTHPAFVYVTVRANGQQRGCWPSHRLGYDITSCLGPETEYAFGHRPKVEGFTT